MNLIYEEKSSSEVLADPVLLEELVQLLTKSWNDPRTLLTKDLAQVERVLLAKDTDGRILGFVTWILHKLEPPYLEAAYFGLGSVLNEFQRRGIGTILTFHGFRRAQIELTEKYGDRPDSFFLWSTTISPLSHFGLYSYLSSHFVPGPDGAYNKKWERVLPQLKAFLNVKKDHEDRQHPFVLRSHAHARFLEDQWPSLNRARELGKLPMYDEMNLIHEKGDLIIIAFEPTLAEIDQVLSKFSEQAN